MIINILCIFQRWRYSAYAEMTTTKHSKAFLRSKKSALECFVVAHPMSLHGESRGEPLLWREGCGEGSVPPH